MKATRSWTAAILIATVLVGAAASPAFAIFPLIGPNVKPEIIIDNIDPPGPGDIPPAPDDPFIPPPECEPKPCGCDPHINYTPEPATLAMALVGVALGGAFALRKRLAA